MKFWCLSVMPFLVACAGAGIRGGPTTDAQTLFLKGDYRKALILFQKGKDPMSRYYAALCKLKRDRPREAISDLQKLIGSNPGARLTVRLHLALTEAHALAGDAIASLRAARSAERSARKARDAVTPDEMLFIVGAAYLRAGEESAGRQRLEKLVREHPHSGLAAEAALRLEVEGYGVWVGDVLKPGDSAPKASGLYCRLVKVKLAGRTRIYALLDGLSTFGQALSLAGRLRRDGICVKVLP
jgi:tetratricopeptide (TPR) repeat protein